jgi:hypothetical protein
MLLEFVKDRRGRRIGTLVAVGSHDTCFAIGYALCCKKDKFRRDVGVAIAKTRAEHGWPHGQKIPHTLQAKYRRMQERAERYFRTQVQLDGLCVAPKFSVDRTWEPKQEEVLVGPDYRLD